MLFTGSPRGAVNRIRWEEFVVDWDCLVSRYISYKQVWPETEDQQSNILHVVKLCSIYSKPQRAFFFSTFWLKLYFIEI